MATRNRSELFKPGARFGMALVAVALVMMLGVSHHVNIGLAPRLGPLGPASRFLWTPAVAYESHGIGIAQQFEVHLRLVISWDPQGYGLGVRRVVEAQHSVPGRLLRCTLSLPGWSDRPRPYVRLSVILPEN